MDSSATGPVFGPPDDYEPPPARPWTVSGERLSTGETWTETFTALGEVPHGALVDLANAVTIVNGNISYTAAAVIRYLRGSMVPLDVARFDQLVRDPDRPMPVEQLGQVMFWLTGLQAERPTGPLSSSTPGQRDDRDGSAGDSSPQDTPAAS